MSSTDSRAPRRILIVDDNQDTTLTLGLLLEMHGFEVRTANDGASALDLVGSFGPDVVLLDLGLPGMDGFEVARRIRVTHPDPRHPLLVAVTGYGQREDHERTRAAGFSHHLVKPVDLATLREVLGDVPPPRVS